MIEAAKCARCRISVPFKHLDMINRCGDKICPLMSEEARMQRAKELGEMADRAVEDCAKRKSLKDWKGSQLPQSWEKWH